MNADSQYDFGNTYSINDTCPIAGWVSRRFDVKQPAPTLRWRARLSGTCVLISEILCPISACS